MGFHHSKMGRDTLVAMMAQQAALETHLKEDAKVAAARCIGNFSLKKNWPQGDVEEVLAALGLKPWTG
jgi:hypothetical protein